MKRKRSWHHHKPAAVVLKTRRPNRYCRDAHFGRQQEQTCGQQQFSYTPNSTAAGRNWRRQPHSSCRLDSQCSGDREEESSTLNRVKTWVVAVMVVVRNWTIFSCDVSDLCADQRSRVRGYEDCLPHGPSFRLPLRSYYSGFVSTVSTLFCWFVEYNRMLVWDCNLSCFCWFYCCFSFTMQPYRFHPKSKWRAVVQRK